MKQKATFQSRDIGLSSCLLATKKVKLSKTSIDPISGKTIIHLVPKAKAQKMFIDFTNGVLQVNALEAQLWVQKLKNEIFGGKQR